MAIRRFPGVRTGPLGDRMAKFLETYPRADEIRITSAMDGNHGAVSHHYGLTYSDGSPTAALDIGADRDAVKMRDFAKWLYDNYWRFTVEQIHSTPFSDDDGFYVKNQRRFPGGGPYGGPSVIGHFDHIHWATSQNLMTQLEQLAQESTPARLHAGAGLVAAASTAVANTAPVWGWDASDHDWGRGVMNLVAAQRDGISFFISKATEGSTFRARKYREALNRARDAEIPVLGTYHFLWPENIESQVNFWMDNVDEQTPWWKDVPWIWQVDAEISDPMPRKPNPEEIQQTVDLVKRRMARQGNKGYVVVYAPRWLYQNTLTGDYDIWNSDYRGSGAPRAFKDQYQGVGDRAAGWNPMAGRKPRILQFASDGKVGTQPICCVDKFDGDLHDLIRLCGREPLLAGAGLERDGGVSVAEQPAVEELLTANGSRTKTQPVRTLSHDANGEVLARLTDEEQRLLLELLQKLEGAQPSRWV